MATPVAGVGEWKFHENEDFKIEWFAAKRAYRQEHVLEKLKFHPSSTTNTSA